MNRKQQKLYNWLKEHKGYLKKSSNWIFDNTQIDKINNNIYDLDIALKQVRIDFKNKYYPKNINISKLSKFIHKEDYKYGSIEFPNKNFNETPWGKKIKSFQGYTDKMSIEREKLNITGTRQYNSDNVLFIADLHAPWILDGYLEFCKEQQEKYDCGTVIFSGDIIDSGAWSYHEHDPDGMSVKDELYTAKKQLQKVYKMFPVAISLLGNHDLLISRKAKTAGLSQEFIKGLPEVLDAPKEWNFVHEYVKDNVKYIHGSIGNAFKRAVDSRISICQGHLHSQTFVQWSVSEKDAIFGLQVGAGFDRDKYAFDYAKPFAKKPIIGCGLILDKGTTPFVKLMKL